VVRDAVSSVDIHPRVGSQSARSRDLLLIIVLLVAGSLDRKELGRDCCSVQYFLRDRSMHISSGDADEIRREVAKALDEQGKNRGYEMLVEYRRRRDANNSFWCLSAVAAVLLFGLYLMTGCPSCKYIFVRKRLGRNFVSEGVYLQNVVRQDVHRDRDGRIVGTTEREERVPVRSSVWAIKYRCSRCGHEWSRLVGG
jgi:hypothetical protein